MRRAAPAVALAACALLAPQGARANGRFAGAFQIASQPGKPDVLLLRTTFGLLVSKDRGATWDWVCEWAIGYGADAAIEDPAIALTGGGAAIAGVLEGLAVSPDTGCAWAFAGGALAGKAIVDVTVARSSPSTVVAMASAATGDAGGAPWATQLHRSIDDGASFAPYGAALDPTVMPITVDVAPSDAHRIYVTGERSPYGSGSLFVSTNDATTWTERPIPLTMTEKGAYIAAVDPTNEDRVYVRTFDAQSGGGRLLVTDDAGQTFATRFTGQGALEAFALSGDGSKVWIGGMGDGVHLAKTSDFAFAQVSKLGAKCLGWAGRLYACTNDGNFLRVSEDDGTTFAPLLPYCALRGALSCGAEASASACASYWPTLQAALGGPCAPDDGGDDGGQDGGATKPPADGGVTKPPPAKGCGCGQGEPSGLAWLGLAGSALALFRARRARARLPRSAA